MPSRYISPEAEEMVSKLSEIIGGKPTYSDRCRTTISKVWIAPYPEPEDMNQKISNILREYEGRLVLPRVRWSRSGMKVRVHVPMTEEGKRLSAKMFLEAEQRRAKQAGIM